MEYMKYFKPLLTISFLVFFDIYSYSQYSISGVIQIDYDTEIQPASQINVSIIELNKTTETDSTGRFVIRNIKPGKYKLKIIRDARELFGVTFNNLTIDTSMHLDTLLLVPFYAPLRDVTLGGFGKDIHCMKEYYKDNGLLVYDTSNNTFYSHGYFCGIVDVPVKDSIDHYYRHGEWKWKDRIVFFEKGLLNGPTSGYYESRKCGYSGFYREDKLDGSWEFYNENTNETFQVQFKENHLLIDLDLITIKDANTLIRRIEEIY